MTLRACPHFLLSLSLSLFLSLTGEEGAQTLFTGQREIKREVERERDKEREGDRGRENCPELLFLFSKGMTDA
jgi:hypothetical protein